MKTFGFRPFLLAAVLLAGCAPLSDDAIRQLARESSSIRTLAESLAQADGGRVNSLDNDRFLAEVSTDTLSREQFVSTLDTHCDRAHGGTLKTSNDSFRLAPEDIRRHQLEQLAGTRGPITLYLRNALSRTLNSDVNRILRDLQDEAEADRERTLYRQASVLCTGYGSNGLLQIHYLVNYLTRDDAGHGDALWGVATESAFTDSIQSALARAETSAGRAMSEERDTVAHYKGLKDAGRLSIRASMSRPGVYGDQYRMEVELDNRTAEPVNVDPVPAVFKSAAGQSWSAAHDGWIREKAGGEAPHCRRMEGKQVQVPGGQVCAARFWLVIGGFPTPNMILSAELVDEKMELRPVTEFEVRQAEARGR
jgi:hypothetical protein